MRKWRKSGALARTRSGRRKVAIRIIASTIELWWLAATTSGPSGGAFSSPTISTRS